MGPRPTPLGASLGLKRSQRNHRAVQSKQSKLLSPAQDMGALNQRLRPERQQRLVKMFWEAKLGSDGMDFWVALFSTALGLDLWIFRL